MVRFYFLLLLFVSCTSTRNEQNRLRINLNNFSIKPNDCNFKSKTIDTVSFYKLILNNKIIQHRKNRYISLEKIEGLKFYSKGKVGYFNDVNLLDFESLNPKNAIMGVYNCDEKTFNVEYISKSPQKGIYLWKENIFSISKKRDTITAFSETSLDTIQYVKVPLENFFLNYKPDW